jgi:hypothetical protein
MTEPNSRQPADLLEQAVAALRTTPIPAGPSAELVVSTTRSPTGRRAPEQGRQPSRRNRMFRIARLCSIAVVGTVLLALEFFSALPGKKDPPTWKWTAPPTASRAFYPLGPDGVPPLFGPPG